MRQFLAISLALSLSALSINAVSAQGYGKDDKKPPTKDQKAKDLEKSNNKDKARRDVVKKGNDQKGNWTKRTQETRPPRSGQIAIEANRDWQPDRNHQYRGSSFNSIDIWKSASFGRGSRTTRWEPANWRYSIDDSLMEIIYMSERMSNSLRGSYERQVNRNNLKTSQGQQNAWERVQKLDESLEKLRSETGRVPETAMRQLVIDTLENGQLVARSFNRQPELLDLVPDQWDDLQFELNGLARYYHHPQIR